MHLSQNKLGYGLGRHQTTLALRRDNRPFRQRIAKMGLQASFHAKISIVKIEPEWYLQTLKIFHGSHCTTFYKGA